MSLFDRIGRIFGSHRVDGFPVDSWEGGPVFDEQLPVDDASGVEILNDDGTPMEFVVSLLMACCGLSRKEATEAMLSIHFKGAAKIGRMRPEDADRLTVHMNAEAKKSGWDLTCRVCDGQPVLSPGPPSREDVLRRESSKAG